MELRKEWEELLKENKELYIYGAGKIGKRIFNLINLCGKQQNVKGFIVSNIVGNPESIQGLPVFQLDEVSDKCSTILLAVADTYQEEILELLKQKNFEKVVVAYKFHFLDEDNIKSETPNVIMIDTRELCIQQFGSEPRLDIIVRLLAIEEYYNENDYGFAYYNKMQNLRVRKGYSLHAKKRFEKLIKSVESQGYDVSSEIIVDRNLHLLDGSHRIALAIYHKIPYVKIRILNKVQNVQYGMEWFSKNFNVVEYNIIINKYEQVWKTISPTGMMTSEGQVTKMSYD